MSGLKKAKLPAKSKLLHPKGPTDSEYRARYKIFEMSDGTYFDSRDIYWRNIPWDKVVRIIVHIRDERHVFSEAHDGFLCLSHQYINVNKTNYTEWCVGYIKGDTAHLTNINFKTGKVEKRYTEPIKTMEGHIHPLIKNKGFKEQEGLG